MLREEKKRIKASVIIKKVLAVYRLGIPRGTSAEYQPRKAISRRVDGTSLSIAVPEANQTFQQRRGTPDPPRTLLLCLEEDLGATGG